MNRFFGMMPSSKIAIERVFEDNNGYKITIQAGCNGWSILWADCGSTFKDEVDTAENNFKKAFDLAYEQLGGLK